MATAGIDRPPSLSSDAVEALRKIGEERSFSPQSTICDRSVEPHFCVVLSGEVEARLVSTDGTIMRLSRMGAGATFGELSSIRGTAGSSVVVALDDVRILSLSPAQFRGAVKEMTEVREYLLLRLAFNLQETRQEAWEFFRRSQAYNLLLEKGPSGPLIAKASATRKLQDEIATAATNRAPVLITGEEGTGKFFVASKIHEAMASARMPFLAVNARDIVGKGRRVLFGSKSVESGSHDLIGAYHLAAGGVLVIRHAEALSLSSQKMLLGYLDRAAAETAAFPRTRIILTTATDLRELAREERFLAALLDRFSGGTIHVPPLAERRKDILRLANQFLAERGDGKRLSREAGAILFGDAFRSRNVAELRDAVNVAALFSTEPEIKAKHIMVGRANSQNVWETELTRAGMVQYLLRGPFLRVLRGLFLTVFVGTIVFAALAPEHWISGFFSLIVWGVWEPLLVLAFLMVGRLWCAVCPLATLVDFTQALRRYLPFLGSGLDHPKFLKKYSAAITLTGLVAILWAERAFGLLESPRGTAILLSTLLFMAAAYALLYQRQLWCRLLCPLGAFGAVFSSGSALQLRATPSICTTYCAHQACIHGSVHGRGCPVFHHPLHSRPAHECKLCFDCIRSCPHGSVKVYARAPLQALWSAGTLSGLLAPASFALLFVGLLMFALGPREALWREQPLLMGLAVLACGGAGALLVRVFERLFSREKRLDPSIIARIAFSFLVLGWGPLYAEQLSRFPLISDFQVEARAGTLFGRLFEHGHLTLLAMSEIPVLLFGAVLSGFALFRIRGHAEGRGGPPNTKAWLITGVLFLAYFVTALAIAIGHFGL